MGAPTKRKDTKKPATAKKGRPTALTAQVRALVIASLQNGLTVEQACDQANISVNTYYRSLERDEDFREEVAKAKRFLNTMARQKLMELVRSGDGKTVRWYLERKSKDEFSTRSELTGKDGSPLFENMTDEEVEDAISRLTKKAKPKRAKASTGTARGTSKAKKPRSS